MQVERAFDALSERAQGEILKAAQSQAEHRTDALLQAVDMDRFVRGAAEWITPCIPGSSKHILVCLLLSYKSHFVPRVSRSTEGSMPSIAVLLGCGPMCLDWWAHQHAACAGAPLEECVRPGHKLPEDLAATLKSVDK